MPKAIDMSEEFEKQLIQMMVLAIVEIAKKETPLNNVETLGLIATRMLMGAQALHYDETVEKAIKIASDLEVIKPEALVQLRDNMKIAFHPKGVVGVQFHTIQ